MDFGLFAIRCQVVTSNVESLCETQVESSLPSS